MRIIIGGTENKNMQGRTKEKLPGGTPKDIPW